MPFSTSRLYENKDMTIAISLEELQRQRDWMALETMSMTMPNVAELLNRALPEVTKTFRELAAKFSPKGEALEIKGDQKDFLKLIENHRYLDLAPLRASVPEGLNVTYLHYLNELTPMVAHAVEVGALVANYKTYLATVITNRDHRIASTNAATIYKGLEDKRARWAKDLGACFKNGSHNTNVTYGDVVERNNEWTLVFQLANKLSKQLDTVNRKDLHQGVSDISHLVDKFMGLVKGGHIQEGSAEMVYAVAEGAFQVASEIELFAILYYRLLAINAMLKDTTESISKILKHM